MKSPNKALGAAFTAIRDTLGDPVRLGTGEQVGYLRLLTSVATPNLLNPLGAIRTIKAIIESGDYTPMLRTMRTEGMPTIVVHGEKDMIVPFGCAREIAEECDGTLYKVPDAYHSWMIANPRQGADAFRQLLGAELGEVIRNAAETIGIEDVNDHAAWQRELLDPDALLFKFIGEGITEIGVEEPEHVKLDLMRDAQHTHERMSWTRRTYQRWAAKHMRQARSVIRQNTQIRSGHRQ